MTKRFPYGLTDGRLSSAAPQKNSSWCPAGSSALSIEPARRAASSASVAGLRDAGVGQGAADRGQRARVGDLPAGGEEAVG